MYTYKQYLCTMYLCKTFQQHIFTYGEFSALNSGRKSVSVNQWAVNVPDAAADVFASWIQSVWGGRWAAEQSSQSAEDERHLNSGPGEKHLEQLLAPNRSSDLILLKIRLRGSVCPSSLHLPSPICPESSCASRAARAPGFPFPISWGSRSSFLLFSDVQNILKMVEHSLKTHKHTPPMSTFFPESIVDSHTGCDEERLRPPYKSLDSEQRWWSHVRHLTFLNICDFLWWSCVKNRDNWVLTFREFYSWNLTWRENL